MSDIQNLTHRITTENSFSTEKALKEEVINNKNINVNYFIFFSQIKMLKK